MQKEGILVVEYGKAFSLLRDLGWYFIKIDHKGVNMHHSIISCSKILYHLKFPSRLNNWNNSSVAWKLAGQQEAVI